MSCVRAHDIIARLSGNDAGTTGAGGRREESAARHDARANTYRMEGLVKQLHLRCLKLRRPRRWLNEKSGCTDDAAGRGA